MNLCIIYLIILSFEMLQENGPDVEWSDAKRICNNYVNKGNVNFHLELVYGCAGK